MQVTGRVHTVHATAEGSTGALPGRMNSRSDGRGAFDGKSSDGDESDSLGVDQVVGRRRRRLGAGPRTARRAA